MLITRKKKCGETSREKNEEGKEDEREKDIMSCRAYVGKAGLDGRRRNTRRCFY